MRSCRLLALGSVLAVAAFIDAAPLVTPDAVATEQRADPLRVLSERRWDEVDRSVDRALTFLATQQAADGSFRTEPRGQPGVTSLAVMAYLSAGHTPRGGPHAARLRRAIDFCLDCQQPSGLLARSDDPGFVKRYNAGHTMYYNHGITGLMLGEVYGMTVGEQNERIAQATPRAVRFLARSQMGKELPKDNGGWRYARLHGGVDADLSCTAWQLMLLRSAKNAAFDVPDEMIDAAVAYIERSYDPERRVFLYGLYGKERYPSGGAVGGAIVSLAMAGKHRSPMARESAHWLLDKPVEDYACWMGPGNNYHYGVYYGTQAMFQLGGDAWADFFPRVARGLLSGQQRDGSWPPERGIASPYGSCYSTSLGVLSLTPGYQLLPIYQR